MSVSPSTEDPRALVASVCRAAADLVGNPAIADRWDEPSVLEGMTVGALAAHLVRAAGSTLAYLDRGTGEGPQLDAVEYFRQAIDAPIHERIRAVSAEEASAGASEVAAEMRRVANELPARLAGERSDRTVGALGKRRLLLDDFCRTRLIEVLVHVDDLAASVDAEPPAVPEEATGTVVDVLVGIARRRHGDWGVIRALARAERAPASVFPVL